jgi:hypothetical protein
MAEAVKQGVSTQNSFDPNAAPDARPIPINPLNDAIPSTTTVSRLGTQRALAAGAAAPTQTVQQKLLHGTTTKDGLHLKIGSDGRLEASVENSSSTIAFGYVRNNGDYSKANRNHQILETLPKQTNRLVAVNQPDTYDAKVTHHADGRTTVSLTIDESVKVLHLKLGEKEYLISQSDVQRAKEASLTATQSALTQASQAATETSPSDRANTEEESYTPNARAPLRGERIVRPARAADGVKAGQASAIKGSGGLGQKVVEGAKIARDGAVKLTSKGTQLIADGYRATFEAAKNLVSGRSTVSEGTAQNSNQGPKTPPPPTETGASGKLTEAKVDPLTTTATEVSKQSTLSKLKEVAGQWRAKVKVSDWAAKNPFHATVAMLTVSEAVTNVMAASYDPDAEHSAVPELIRSLTKDIEAFEWLQTTFTTQEGDKNNMTRARLAEGASAVGDVALSVTAIAAAQKLVSSTSSRVGLTNIPGVAMLGRTVIGGSGGVLAAVDGYQKFSQGQFIDMNDTQITGAVGGSYSLGIIPFACSGPIGWALGAASAAGGTLYGVSAGLAKEHENACSTSPKKKAVLASIQRALKGFVHSPDSEIVKERLESPKFSKEEREQITELARLDALAGFVLTKQPQELKQLGFIKVEQTSSQDQIDSANSHNYGRMLELLGEKSWYSWSHPSDAVKKNAPATWKSFNDEIDKATKFYEDLYQRSIRVSYMHEGKLNTFELWKQEFAARFGFDRDLPTSIEQETATKLSTMNELTKVCSTVVESLTEEDRKNPLKVLNKLTEHFPQLPEIMRWDYMRQELVNELESQSGEAGQFKRALSPEAAAEQLDAVVSDPASKLGGS